MSILDNTRLMVKVCKLCYEENMSQAEVSEKLHISKPQVSRIINAAREKGILNIYISNPFAEELELEKIFMEKYGLDQVFIADAGDGPSETQFTSFTRQCAQQLESIMPDNANIGVMSGKTISAVAKQFPSARKKHLHFIPLVGAIGNSGNDWNANSIARILAFKTDSSYSVLTAPVLTQSQKARDYFVQEPDIASVLKEGERCDMALVGIGQISTHSTAYLSGAYQDEDLAALEEAGAVASVSISYIDKNGSIIETSLSNRSIAWPLKKYPKTNVVLIATGLSKAEGLKAVLKGGYINTLMISLKLAKAILETE